MQIVAPVNNKEPILKLIAHPENANPKGDIFGGWLMSQIDIAGSIISVMKAKGSVSTVAVKNLQFLKPIYVHDLVCFYASITHVGKTSITTEVNVHVQRASFKETNAFVYETIKVAEAIVVYVAVSEPGKKREVPVE
ncbi:MAG: putative acyl-CoA thioester hydrolase [Legionellaceae bacterium]